MLNATQLGLIIIAVGSGVVVAIGVCCSFILSEMEGIEKLLISKSESISKEVVIDPLEDVVNKIAIPTAYDPEKCKPIRWKNQPVDWVPPCFPKDL